MSIRKKLGQNFLNSKSVAKFIVDSAKISKDDTGAGHVFTKVNEHAQLWTYRAWAEWMAAESWKELKERHSLVQDNV